MPPVATFFALASGLGAVPLVDPGPSGLRQLRRALRHQQAALRALGRALGLVWAESRRRRADRELLRAMDEPALRDLGIGRDQIDALTLHGERRP